MDPNFDDMEPWERYEHLRRQEEAESLPEAGERLLVAWKRLLTGTFTGAGHGASQVTLARLLKVLSDADLLLARLVGCGTVRVGLWFDPKLATEQADDLAAEGRLDPAVIENLRGAADDWYDASWQAPPLTPHFLFAAMLHWCQGGEFTWQMYEQMMPQLFRVGFVELIKRLHLVDPGRLDDTEATIAAVAGLPIKVAAPVFVRFENRHDGHKTRDFGPYVWVQMVHDELKVAPSGRHLATLYSDGGAPLWAVQAPGVPSQQAFTDVIIGPAEVPDGWVQPDDDTSAGEPAG